MLHYFVLINFSLTRENGFWSSYNSIIDFLITFSIHFYHYTCLCFAGLRFCFIFDNSLTSWTFPTIPFFDKIIQSDEAFVWIERNIFFSLFLLLSRGKSLSISVGDHLPCFALTCFFVHSLSSQRASCFLYTIRVLFLNFPVSTIPNSLMIFVLFIFAGPPHIINTHLILYFFPFVKDLSKLTIRSRYFCSFSSPLSSS